MDRAGNCRAAHTLGVAGSILLLGLATRAAHAGDDAPAASTVSVTGQRATTGYVNVRAGYQAGPDDVALDAHAESAGIVPLGRHGPTSSVNVTWKHTLDRTLSLSVNVGDLFHGSRRTYATDAATFRQAGFDHFIARRVWVGFVKKIE